LLDYSSFFIGCDARWHVPEVEAHEEEGENEAGGIEPKSIFLQVIVHKFSDVEERLVVSYVLDPEKYIFAESEKQIAR
jgi:hypothetical protein